MSDDDVTTLGGRRFNTTEIGKKRFMEQKLNIQKPEIPIRHSAADEIDLVQLVLILWKRKTMILVVTLLLVLAATAVSFVMPKVYEVVAIIEPGKNSEGKLVENPQAIRENILSGAYDQIVTEQLSFTLDRAPVFKVSVPNQTDLIKISMQSSAPEQAVIILQNLLMAVSADIQQSLDIEIKKTENEIKTVQLQNNFFLEQIKLLKEQMTQIELKVTDLEKERKKAMAEPKGDAMAILLYSNEVQNQQIYLNDLQEKLAKAVSDRNQSVLRIEDIQLKLTSFKGTNITKLPTIPEEPKSPKKSLIIALAAMLGLMGSVMLAFCVEFFSNARRRMNLPQV